MAQVLDRQQINLKFRASLAVGSVAFIFFLLILRLWYLQILNGDHFRERSENNLRRTVFIPPPRGLIFDRNGQLLVGNRPAFSVDLVVEDCPNPKATIYKVANLLSLDPNELYSRFYNQTKRRRYEPQLLVKDLSRDQVAIVMANRYELPGVVVTATPARKYLYGAMGAHVFGYIREITKGQLDKPRYSNYMIGDLVGQYGLENRWENYLQGLRGVQTVVVNASGLRIGELSFEHEIAGNNIKLTMDLNVQKAAYEALEGLKGAVVAMAPDSGEILALSSSPGFDPNMFAGELKAEEWQDLVAGPGKRLSNRAVQGAFPPGSVFKIVMAVAALSEGVVTPSEKIFCPGYLVFGNRKFRCHKHAGHGAVDLRKAMAESCDVYFYTVGQRLGIDRIHDYADMFGFGRPTGLDLVTENAGVVPSTAWKKAYFKTPEHQKWYPGETLSVAIGQGALTITPLQLVRSVSALLNGGFLMEPHLVKEIKSHDGTFIDDSFTPKILNKLEIDPKIRELVRQSLVAVVNDVGGTGRRSKMEKYPDIKVGGKSGTAQVVSLGRGSHLEKLKDHAWFIGFAPADKPEIVVAALVENGGSGGATSGPIVSKVMEAYFDSKTGAETAKGSSSGGEPKLTQGMDN